MKSISAPKILPQRQGLVRRRQRETLSPKKTDGTDITTTARSRFSTTVQNWAHIATVIALIWTIWTTNALADAQKLRSELEASQRAQQNSQRNLLGAQVEQRRMELERQGATLRLHDLEAQRTHLASQILLAEADLRTRMGDVSMARTELQGLRSRIAAVDSALQAARQTLTQTTLTAFVTTHLGRKKEELLEDRQYFVMLYDPADRDFSNLGTFINFEIQARGNATEDPRHCRLSERFVMVGQGQEELDVRREPVMKALCEYLRGVQTGGMELGDANRAAKSGRGFGTLQRWETLGDDGPFEIVMQPGSRAGGTFESDSVRSFWSLMDAAGALSVPGTRELLTTLDPAPDSEGARLVAEVEALSEEWHAFADNLQSDAFYKEWESGEGIGPPPLKKLERVSVAKLRVGWAVTTRGFERKLLCAAAWYAEQRQLLEQFARASYCAVY